MKTEESSKEDLTPCLMTPCLISPKEDLTPCLPPSSKEDLTPCLISGGKHFSAADLLALSSHERRLLDQFAYRFKRLQDDMGGRLFPALLGALGEEVAAKSVIDRLNRLEQLGWIPLADEWLELRRIRNEFAHDYPENPELHLVRMRKAMAAGWRPVKIMEAIVKGKQSAWHDG